ncbi:MAG: hypothetical protein LBE50_04525, partial [Gallionellaceae bacterium]|nr:hypothetical protein [Gallionellaceae bacterium]
MNRQYKTIFNRSLGVWQAVSELARGQGKSSRLLSVSALVGALALAAVPAQAQVVIGGDVTDNGVLVPPGNAPSDPWITAGDLTVGSSNTGTLDIASGSTVSSGFNTIIGDQSGSIGTVTVDGTNSLFETSDFTVGYFGDGTLNITDGGRVETSSIGRVGVGLGNGVVTVDGNSSFWDLSNASLYVGDSGTGTITITNGGSVSSFGLSIGDRNIAFGNVVGTGVVTVDGQDSTLNVSGNSLIVGSTGIGTLNITDGGTVNSDNSYVGYQSDGKATVDGEDSTWDSPFGLVVGESGDGTLDILNGGTVSSGDTLIADLPNSTGTVTVDGENSLWTVNGDFTVGYLSDATLNITGGGRVETSGTINWVGFADGSSTVTVDGDGSAWETNGQLTVGDFGIGTLNITNGGNVSSN